MIRRIAAAMAIVAALAASPIPARAATLPPHAPLRIMIVSDEVNPHGLSAAQLTQPGDLSAAITAPGSGINLDAAPDAVVEIATDDLADATALLALPIDDPGAYDVLIYFAHRIPAGGGGAQDQADFVAAVDSFLAQGGGVISFHHGAYLTAGKDAMQDIIGGTATGNVPWNTTDGQNVIDVGPGHFITSNEIEYAGSVAYADAAHGVAADNYEFFNNTPDERYPFFTINPSAGDVEMLFASDYNDNGTTHVLGFTHRRPSWAGVVVVYQPGEYQPNALDDLDGNNFQILANAIFYASYGVLTGAATPRRANATLAQNYPNPFNPATTIAFALAETGPVSISIFDVRGSMVRRLVDGRFPAGTHHTTWDGRRDDGTAAASGIYYYRMTASGEVLTRKMLLVK
jgi:hypothetical protein